MAFRQLLIPRIAIAGSPRLAYLLPYHTLHGNRVTYSHHEEVGVSADGPANAHPSGAATAAPPARTLDSLII
jgi:hypothetical protein